MWVSLKVAVPVIEPVPNTYQTSKSSHQVVLKCGSVILELGVCEVMYLLSSM